MNDDARTGGRQRLHRRVGGCLAAVDLAVVLGAPATAFAHDVTGPCSAVMDPNNAPSTDPRIDHLTVAGTNVNVLVPPGYRAHGDDEGGRRYPVLYLFHGAFSDEDSFSTQTDLLSYTASLPEDQQVIVVMPDGGHLPAGRDWVDGTHPQETYVIGTLIPWIDAHYRTIANGGHRAAGGFSAGGLNATIFAARHPELFAAAATFSGFLDPFDPNGIAIVDAFVSLEDGLCGGTVDPDAIWGDPVLHPMGWTGHDPVYDARSLGDVSIYISAANGNPCPDQVDADPFLMWAESVVYEMSQSFDAALTQAGVEHVTKFRDCGIHTFTNSNQSFREFWPQMFQAFGRHRPHHFDWRTGDSSAAAWGWNFAADSARAPEFLDVTDASKHGVTLTGSGSVTVTTGPIFGHHEHVTVNGLGPDPQVLVADDDGRLTFSVVLEAPHSLEEYTAEELAAQAADPGYFATKAVTFGHDHDDCGDDDDH